MTLGLDGCFNDGKQPKIIDLADTPWWLEVFSKAVEWLTDGYVQLQMRTQAEAIEQLIRAELTEPGLGYLLRVNQMNQGGVRIMTAAGPFTPIGVGTEPLEALASFLARRPNNKFAPDGVDEESCYKWIYRDDTGIKLAVQEAASIKVKVFEDVAMQEARKLKALGAEGTDPHLQIARIQRSEAWLNAVEKLDAALLDEQRKARLAQYTREMASAQAAFNDAYVDAQLAFTRAAREARFQAVLRAIEGIASIAKAGIDLTNASTKASPPHTGMLTSESHKVFVDAANGYAASARETMMMRWNAFGLIETKLIREFGEIRKPAPPREAPQFERVMP